MKRLSLGFILAAASLSSVVSQASWETTQSFPNLKYYILGREGLSEPLIKSNLIRECVAWAGLPKKRCHELFALYWQNMDMRFFHGHEYDSGRKIPGLLIVFHSDLVNLLSKPQLLPLMREWTAALDGGDIDFWELHKSAYIDDAKRLQLMATLYQDVSLALAPAHYFANVGAEVPEESLKAYRELLHAIVLRRVQSMGRRQTIYLPPSVLEDCFPRQTAPSDSFYHFYVPARISQKLWKDQSLTKREAAIMPFLLSFSYKANTQSWKSLASLPTQTHLNSGDLDRLYLAYLGIHFGLNGATKPKITRALFARIFSGDPKDGLYWVLRSVDL